MSNENLTSRFEAAGLELKLLDAPAGFRGSEDTFFMDIQRKIKGNARSEYFRIYPGHQDNRCEVVNIDKKLQQLVLMVHEPARPIVVDVPTWSVKHQKERHGANWFKEMLRENRISEKDVVARNDEANLVTVRRMTPSHKRHYLCGVDERQLFIAQLPKAITTVREAHESLKSTNLVLAEGKQRGRTIRQGEWFFVNVTSDEKRMINDAVRKSRGIIHKKVPIGNFAGRRGGKPHTADELLTLAPQKLEHGFPVQNRDDIFVRGKVRHTDHATVSFSEWRRVIRNAEGGGSMAGIGWID